MAKIIPKVENLIIGKEYTYKELCEALGEKITGNRETQHIRWNRFFIYEHIGRTYRIIQIRETPLPDGRSNGNNSKYIIPFKDIIMFYLSNYDTTIYESANSWLIKLKIATQNISKDDSYLANEYQDICNKYNFSFLKNCHTETKDFIGKKFKSAIDSLEKNNFLTKEETYRIVISNNKYKIATKQEANEFDILLKDIMKEFGVSSTRDALYKNKLNKVYNKMNTVVNTLYGYQYVYKVIGLKRINKNYKYTYDITNAYAQFSSLIYTGLYDHFINSLIKNQDLINEKKDEYLKKYYNSEDTSEIEFPFEYKENYSDMMMEIAELFLSI